MSKAKAVKKKTNIGPERKMYRMKIVLSDTCEKCPTPCARGIRYREHMRRPGAAGKGVPCILTRTLV